VLDLVLAVTERKRPQQNSMETWQIRKTEQVAKMAEMSEEAVLIKTADLLHNLSSMLADLEAGPDGEKVWSRLNAGPDRQMWYFNSVLAGARDRLGAHPLVVDLERTVRELGARIPRNT
jgi:hypothetical protein